MSPPSPASTVDSIRNCCRIARRVAPIALRMPISRVRSVTVTSMMFMMPIPPTSSEIPATALVSSVRKVRNCVARVDEVLLRPRVEVALGRVGDPVARVEDRVHLCIAAVHGRAGRGLDEQLVERVAAAQ